MAVLAGTYVNWGKFTGNPFKVCVLGGRRGGQKIEEQLNLEIMDHDSSSIGGF